MSASNEQQAGVAPASAMAAELNDEQVREYLKDNGDFFQRNPDMLDHLHITHASGSAVSLVEKQVSVLRERNIDMRHRLSALTANARENDKLYDQTSKLVLKLLEAGGREELCRIFTAAMSEDFEVEHASIILFGEGESSENCRIENLESVKQEIGSLLRGRKPVCGVLRKEELSYLFPSAGEVGSAALMPMAGDEDMGLIAVGSSDAERYSSSMGTLFLSHIADVLARLLPRLESPEA